MRTRDIHDLGFSCFANIDIYISHNTLWRDLRDSFLKKSFDISSLFQEEKHYREAISSDIKWSHDCLSTLGIRSNRGSKRSEIRTSGNFRNSDEFTRDEIFSREPYYIGKFSSSLSNTRNTFARQLRFFQRKRFSTIFARSKQQWFLSRVMQIFF